MVIEASAQGAGYGQQMMTPFYRDDITGLPEMGLVARQLYAAAGLSPGDIDLANLYDAFTPNVLMQLESFGFCGKGESGPYVEGGARIAPDGELPLNTNGGQLSGGRLHGYGFLHEACVQLWGEGGERQVKKKHGDPKVALAAAGGGPLGGCMLLSSE